MSATWLLTKRAVREGLRTPEGTIPLLFIPVFFLLVNTGQLGKELGDAPFLHGQSYLAFQLPISLIFAVIGIGSGLALVGEIENGYFDKLLVAPIPRTTILLGRLAADFLRNLVTGGIVLIAGLALGARVETGVAGGVLLIVLCALFGVAYGSSAILIALKTKSTQTVNVTSYIFFPLLFLAPNLVPREGMQGWMRVAAGFNPVTYVIEGVRSLMLVGWETGPILACVAVVIGTAVVILGLCVQSMRSYGT